MPGNDLNTNIPFNPINPGVMPEPTKTERSAIDSVINAFKEMKDTATEGAAQFKALFKSSPTDATRTDVKTSNVVTTFFSKTIPEFGKSLVDHASSLKDRIDNFVNEDKKRLAVEAQYLPALGAEHHEHIPLSDRLASTVKPLTQKLTQLSEAASPTLKALSEKVDSLKSSIPNPLEMFKSNIETGDELAFHTDSEPSIETRDVQALKENFYAKLNAGKDRLPFRENGYKDGMETSLLAFKKAIGFKENPEKQITYNFATGSKREAIKFNGFSIESKKTYHLGPKQKAHITGAKLKELQESARVTYDPSVVKDPSKLAEIMSTGPGQISDRLIGSGRCVVSTDILHTTFDNQSIAIDKRNVDRYQFQSYTVSAPNLNDQDINQAYLGPDGKVDLQKWKGEMTRLLTHILTEAKKDNVEMLVLPAIGMGAFMPENLRGQAPPLFLEALKEAKQESGMTADVVVTGINLPNEEGIRFEEKKDSMAVLQMGLESGLKTGCVNAGDSSCQTGQHAVESLEKRVTNIAQEEHKSILDTSILTQNANANPRMADANYYAPYK